MDRSDDRSTSPYGGGDRDARAGGKLRKPPARKPPPSPYARPPPAAAAQSSHRREGGGGWFSKIVAGSTRFLPSFFSKSLPDCNDQEEDQDASDGDEGDNLNVGFQSSEVAGPSRAEDEPMCDTSIEEQRQDRNGLSEIEQLLNGKSLSRDEISRLTEILNSKASSLSNADQGKQNYIMTGEGETVGTLVAHKNPRTSTEEKLEGLNKDLWGTSTPLPSSTVRDVVGASPVDIARAFMGSRTSETDFSSRTIMSKVERVSADEYELKPAIPLPSPKPICWPGAIVQDQRGYMTPQNERGKMGLHNFPRTPYSRTIFSKSKSKLAQLQGGSSSCINTSSSSFQQFGSPSHEEVRSRGNVLNNCYGGSVGPIRRVRHNVVDRTPSRGSVSLNPYANNRSNLEKPHTNASFSHVFKNLEPGMTGSTSKFRSEEIKPHNYEVGSTSVPSQSTLIARKILEHIDRKMPTPAEKSAEIKLAMSSKRPLSSEASTVGSFNSLNDMGNQTFSSQKNEYAQTSLFNSHPEDRSALKTKDEGNQNTSASNLKIGNAVPSFDFIKNNYSQIKSVHEETSMGVTNYKEKDNNELRPLHNYMNGQLATKTAPNTTSSNLNLKKPRPHSFGNKPVLPSISINMPGLNTSASLNSGFTFPVSASSGALSEPPTPSIMPSSSSPTKKGPTIPTYSFGSKRSAPALVFSFPSTSNGSALENSEIKFNFGSDNKSRVSFGSVGKDGVVIKT